LRNLTAGKLFPAARPTREQIIVVHEAGHAVASRLMRLPECGEVSIIEPRAHAVFDCGRGAASFWALMAGAVVESIAFGDYDGVGTNGTEVDANTLGLLNAAGQMGIIMVKFD
jgi:hypothetical protein